MKNCRSFTLVELLIASSIFALVMVALYAAFSSGVFGYRNIQERIDAYQQARLVLEHLDRDLRNSFAYSAADTKFSGQGDKVSFLSLADDYRGNEIISAFAFISYYLEGDKLMRLCRKDQESLDPDSKIKADEFAFGVEKIAFTYIYQDKEAVKEKDTWDDPKSLPLAVKVDLTLKNKNAYAFERTIYLLKEGAGASIN